jgi:CelD/BcsL family acetyltransferase involved in cellulose biosynthesis
LAQGLLQFGRPINLGHRPAASPLIGEIRRSGAGRVVVASRPLDRHLAPFLDLDPSWSAPERYLSKSRMQSIRRRQRQLEAMGELTVAFLTPDETAVDAVLETAFKVEAKGWKQAEGIALEADPAQAAFYRSYARVIAAKGRLHVTLLSVDGTPLAMSIGEIYRGTYWAYKTGFDSAFRKYAPGILLQYRLVQHLAEQGLTRLDFQGQLDDFKRIWTERAVEAAAFRIYPLTPRGLFALGVDLATHGRNALTSWVQQVGARVRGRSPGPGAKPSAAS